jgi:tRNA(Ile)-lysidine synthase
MASSRNSPNNLPAHVAARVAAALPPGAPVCVGFSGGLDSVVLLDLLAAHSRGTRAIAAVHVHHGLSPNADAWAAFCRAFCDARRIPLAIEKIGIDRDAPEGIESAARRARYAVYAQRPEPYVALAHHLDDQAETVLLQLLRGTGLKGIAAMPEVRALPGASTRIFRPLLGLPRASLAAHAEAAGLRWIDDESNASSSYDRNFLRHEVAPLLDARFPGWRDAANRFSRHAAGVDGLLADLAQFDGVPREAGEGLPVDASLAPARRGNALRAYLALNGIAMPSEARLAEMSRQLYEARDDARVRIEHAGIALVRHRGSVLIEVNAAGARDAWRVEWRGEAEVDLGCGRGEVKFEKARGRGIAPALRAGSPWYFMPRNGGERIRLEKSRPTRTLKNLLQEHDIPAWQRDRMPLLFHAGRLVWVPGIGISAEYACGDAEEGFLPCWRVAGRTPVC